MTTQTKTREVPAAAFRFSSPCEFAKGDERDPVRHPFTGLARSAQPITHWYWGRVVHDFSGMKPRNDRVQLDWCHWSEEAVGIVNKFDVKPDGLHIAGEVQSIREADKASEIIARGRLGHPYELSIDFTDPAMVIEEVSDGVVISCNGQQFTGPLTVIRQWELRSVAVCPFGRDPNTEAKFSDGQQQPSVSVTVLTQEPSMLITNAAQPGATPAPAATTQLAEQPAAATPQTAVAPGGKAELLSDLAKFTDLFGDAQGVAHFKAGTDFVTALTTEFKALKTQFAAKDEEIAQLKSTLSATQLGATQPVGASDATPAPGGTAPTQFAHLGPAAAYAASLSQKSTT